MKISILTTITNPEERQDKWIEALSCYYDLADEVVVVNGGSPVYTDSHGPWEKIKFVNLPWSYNWNWIELPRHLNAGLKKCTGDWIIKLDIDQFIHEKDFERVRKVLAQVPEDCDVATFQKMSMVYGKKYYQKGGREIAFRNKPYIRFGKNLDKPTDLCFPVKVTSYEKVCLDCFNDATKGDFCRIWYKLPVGRQLKTFKTGISYWNYDYTFKAQDFVKEEFWRFSQAYYRYFKKWTFGRTKRKAFQVFLNMMKGRHDRAPYTYTLKDHPKYIREAIKNLTKEQFGLNAWGLL